jgi:hypothetical protein
MLVRQKGNRFGGKACRPDPAQDQQNMAFSRLTIDDEQAQHNLLAAVTSIHILRPYCHAIYRVI